jgi:hypothetical protein
MRGSMKPGGRRRAEVGDGRNNMRGNMDPARRACQRSRLGGRLLAERLGADERVRLANFLRRHVPGLPLCFCGFGVMIGLGNG